MTKRGRPKTDAIYKVFDVMAKHDFNVKSASQDLKITKSAIYSIKNRNKEKWAELLKQHNEKQGEELVDIKENHLIRASDKRIDRSKRGVKSEMAEKYVNKTFKISDEKQKSKKIQNLRSAKEQSEHEKSKKQPVNAMRSPTGESIKEENKRLISQNEELGQALDRANKEKSAVAEEHNSLIDAYEKIKSEIENYRTAHKNLTEDYEKLSKATAHSISEEQKFSKKLEEKIEDIKKMKRSVDTSVIVLSDYLVKLGKVYVDGEHTLVCAEDMNDYNPLSLKDAKSVAEFTGGQIYQTAIVPHGGEVD